MRRRMAQPSQQPVRTPGFELEYRADMRGLKPNGLLCSVCKGVQYDSPGGATCEQGHGGVGGVEPHPTIRTSGLDSVPAPSQRKHRKSAVVHTNTPPQEQPRARISFVPVATTHLLQLDAVPEQVPEGVRGAIVKVSPTIRASERDSFNGSKLAAELRGAGALAVQLAPVTIPDTVSPQARRAVSSAPSPEDAVRAFFQEVLGAPEEDRAAGEALALELVEACQT